MSRMRVICPPAVVLRMISPNSEASESEDGTLAVIWKSWPAGVGGMPTWPAATYAFCACSAPTTSEGISERWSICSGSSQTRMLYSPTPKTTTSPTPGRRASLSESCSVAKFERKSASNLSPFDESVMIWRGEVSFFLVTTPCCWTGPGS